MARPEAPIPDHRPMKAVAECLRQLRREAGQPSYRRLGQLVHLEQQSLSQTANGKRVGWLRILNYVEALRLYNPEAVTPDDLAALKQLYEAGERQHTLQIERGINRRCNAAIWEEIDSATVLSARSAERSRAPGQWDITPGVTDVRQLNTAVSVSSIYLFLINLATSRGINVRRPPRPRLVTTTEPAFSWFGGTPATPPPMPPQIPDPAALTLPLLLEVVRLCGGTDGDCRAWQSAWERVHRAPAPTKRPPADHTGTATDRQAAPPEKPKRFPHGSTVWRWPGNVMRRPEALGEVIRL